MYKVTDILALPKDKYARPEDKTKTHLSPEMKHYFIYIEELKNEITNIYRSAVEMVANDILKELDIKLVGTEVTAFYHTASAMLRSIRSSILHAFIVCKNEELQKGADTLYEELDKIKKGPGFDSPIPEIEIKSKNTYYEKCFLKRAFIQCFDFKYKDLNETVNTFIRENEKYKLYYTSYNSVKWYGKECNNCHQLCCQKGCDICDYCFDYDLLMIYIRLCKFFKVIGNFYLFKYYMTPTALEYLTNNKEFFDIFKKSFKLHFIKRYAYYHFICQSITKEEEKEKPKYLIRKRARGREEVKAVNDPSDLGQKSFN